MTRIRRQIQMLASRLVTLGVVLLVVVMSTVAEAGMTPAHAHAHRLGGSQSVIVTARLREHRRLVGKMRGIETEFEITRPMDDTVIVVRHELLQHHHRAGMTATGIAVDLGTIHHHLTDRIGIVTDVRHQRTNETVLRMLIGPLFLPEDGRDLTPEIVCGIEMYIGRETKGEGRGQGRAMCVADDLWHVFTFLVACSFF